MVIIRSERPEDVDAVRAIHEKAFGQSQEARLVDALRTACREAVSLVALVDDRVVGHVLFTPTTVTRPDRAITGMGLGPMAVIPDYQRRGMGRQLVQAGLDLLRRRNYPFVVVLGHPGYYPRFGFVPASRRGLACRWENVPDEAFMVKVLDESAMAGVSGTVAYRNEFDDVM